MGKTTTTNVGLDISLFNSRVNLALDWYNNESSNLLIKIKFLLLQVMQTNIRT